MYTVIVKKKVLKGMRYLPAGVVSKYLALQHDLEVSGPVQPSWPNYSQLGDGSYHCHLDYHHVACWRNENGTITIEVYYVGSREGAPY